ncbi:MAG: FAD-dependent 5-carboxymethylaminomethyl-2-thiouridine(34) oxidoreductase MnmC [Cocleimonas sp.]
MKNNAPWFQYPAFNWNEKKATIIGGGIAGAQAAWHLCQTGWKVTLIERHTQLATEASGNPAGVLSPKMTAIASKGEDFYTQSFQYTLSQLNILKQTGHNVDWDACGVLQIAHNEREEKRWHALKKRGFAESFIQLLDEKQNTAIAGIDLPYKTSYFPTAGWINPASFVKALAQKPNCTVIYQSSALNLNKVDKHWQVQDTKNQLIAKSEVIIIANGKDLFSFKQSKFLQGLAVAGQTTSADVSGYSKKLKTVIGHEGYLTPSKNGQHIFGATFERGSHNPTLKKEADDSNFSCLQLYLPNLAKSFADLNSAHTAVRMTTPDRYPYVGALPDSNFYQSNYHDLHQGKQYKQYSTAKYQEGLFVLGGFGSRGLITSGYCAKALVDLLENKVNTKEIKQVINNCHPARFLIKKLKQNKTKRPLHESVAKEK